MIARDQPACFPDDVLVAISSRHDGTVLDRSIGTHDESIVSNRTKLCDALGMDYGSVVFQRIIYSPQATYRLIADVDERTTSRHTSECVADALFTASSGVGLLLPVADCVATVVYDPKRRYLALLHLGRHSTFTSLIADVTKHFQARGSNPAELLVWMSPSAQKTSYRLEYFEAENDPAWQGYFEKRDGGYFVDMQGYNRQRFVDVGVDPAHITVSEVDTVTDENYFSHSAGDTHGRFAVIAALR